MDFATAAIALYVGHHVGDYWVQTDHQAAHKGLPGRIGRLNCLMHTLTYVATQAAVLAIVVTVTGKPASFWWTLLALVVSGLTHYTADRREYGLMVKLARLLPGKDRFLTLGVPRVGRDDNPSLGTGAWALDQSWHIFWGVFVAALILTL